MCIAEPRNVQYEQTSFLVGQSSRHIYYAYDLPGQQTAFFFFFFVLNRRSSSLCRRIYDISLMCVERRISFSVILWISSTGRNRVIKLLAFILAIRSMELFLLIYHVTASLARTYRGAIEKSGYGENAIRITGD